MDSEKHYNANGYISPFLVKAFSKGKFNIDMGIITAVALKVLMAFCVLSTGLVLTAVFSFIYWIIMKSPFNTEK